MLKSFQLVEDEGSGDAGTRTDSAEMCLVKLTEGACEAVQTAVDALAVEGKDACSLSVGDLGDETMQDLAVQVGQPQPEVEPKGLRREGTATTQAAAARYDSAIALAAINAEALHEERSAGPRRAVRVRAEGRNESHGRGVRRNSTDSVQTTIPGARGYRGFPILNTERGQIPLGLA